MIITSTSKLAPLTSNSIFSDDLTFGFQAFTRSPSRRIDLDLPIRIWLNHLIIHFSAFDFSSSKSCWFIFTWYRVPLDFSSGLISSKTRSSYP